MFLSYIAQSFFACIYLRPMWTFVFLLLILDSVKVYCLHVQMPQSLCVLQDSLMRRKVHLTKLICLAKPQNKNLSLFTCFHLKTKTKNLHHIELGFAEKHFSKLRKISMRRMAHTCLSCGPFRSRGHNRDLLWLLVGDHVDFSYEKWKQDSPAELWMVFSAAWEIGRSRWRDLQDQATQDLGTTQGVISPLA